ncbi:MAG: NAD-dependent epimerase/dehydratase family protein [Bryobacterales bacterium]|nr:NAD-dependent epimerase/dehydratase family protein [Bryobacterales bacterium]
MPRSKALFVTGGGGYVGRRFLAAIPEGCFQSVVALLRPRSHPPAVGPHVRLIYGDLLDPPTYGYELAECETVVHLAAATGKKPPAVFFRDNVEATRRLLEMSVAAGVRNFLHISSIAVGFSGEVSYPYGESKREAESLVAISGLHYLILRPTMIIGEKAPVLESLAKLAGAPLTPVFGDGKVKVQPLFVDDLLDCMFSVLSDGYFPNEALDLGGPQVLSMDELLEHIRLARRQGKARLVHVPVKLVLPLIALLEKAFLRLMPFTSGQLASFINASIAAPSTFLASRQPGMKTVDQVLATLTS